MENKIKNIGFALIKIITEQFAIIEDGYSKNGEIRISTNLRFGADDKKKIVAVFSSFTFESNQKPFIVIEVGCHFNIINDAWDKMYNIEKKSLVLPKGFLSHLAMLTVGTTRGVLHSKTENTSFNEFVLPAINVAELIKEDAVITFNT